MRKLKIYLETTLFNFYYDVEQIFMLRKGLFR